MPDFRVLEKWYHFISQYLLMAHLLVRCPQSSWWKDSRYHTMTHTGEEHLTQLHVLLQLHSPAALLCPAFLFLTHPQNHTGLASSDGSWATSGLQQLMGYPYLCHLCSLGAKAKGLRWEIVQLLPCAGLLFHLEFPMSFLAMKLKLSGKLLWLKVSSSTPGMPALVWTWTDYLCCWYTSSVGKSTINYICYSIYKITY